MPTVRLDGRELRDWPSFHRTFADVFGFPDWYGRNMDAWIDCMSSLEVTGDGTITVHVDHASAVPQDVFDALVECAAFVNWRCVEGGGAAILALSYWREPAEPIDPEDPT